MNISSIVKRIKGASSRLSLLRSHTVSMASSVVSRRSMLRRSLTYIFFFGVTLLVLSICCKFNELRASTSQGMKATSTLLILFRPSTTASMYDRLLIPIDLFFCLKWKPSFLHQASCFITFITQHNAWRMRTIFLKGNDWIPLELFLTQCRQHSQKKNLQLPG